MNKTAIPYLDFAWNPVTGCTYGCPECWARKMHLRFWNDDFKPRPRITELIEAGLLEECGCYK
jgi:protein gp37